MTDKLKQLENEALNKCYSVKNAAGYSETAMREMFQKGIEATNIWISVDEELPDKKLYDWVLIRVKEVDSDIEYVPKIGELRSDGLWHTADSDLYGFKLGHSFEKVQKLKVTHWRPIEL